MTKYEAALHLIRLLDRHRILARSGLNTWVDDFSVMDAHYEYRRNGKRKEPGE